MRSFGPGFFVFLYRHPAYDSADRRLIVTAGRDLLEEVVRALD